MTEKARRIALALMEEYDFEHYYERSGGPYDSGMFSSSEIDRAEDDRNSMFAVHSCEARISMVDLIESMSRATIIWLESILDETVDL